MFPILRIGPLAIQTPGLALLAGLWFATTLIEREALRRKLNATAILNMIFLGLAGFLAGARLIHALLHASIYLSNPLGLFSLDTKTLNLHGGLIVATLVVFFYGRRQKLPLRSTLDSLTPGLAVFMIALGIANIFSGNGYGTPADLPWSVYLWGDNRHPTQFYETMMSAIIFLLWKIKSTASVGPGIRFLQFVALTAGAQIFLQGFRGESLLMPGGFRAAQIIGLTLFAAAMLLMKSWLKEDAEPIKLET